MIIFLYGPDTFSSRERLTTLRQAFITKHDPTGVNVIRLDGSQLTVERFNAAVKSGGLLSSKRLVIVERLLTDNRKKTIASEVARFLTDEKIPTDTILIFWEGDVTGEEKPTRRKVKKVIAPKKEKTPTVSLFDVLRKQKLVAFFPLLPQAQVRRWVVNRATRQGTTLEAPAVDLLVEHAQADLWRLHNEIDLLASYRPGAMVTVDDVRHFSAGNFNETIFKLTDAIGQKNRTEALRLMHAFLAAGEPPLYILGMLVRQFRILIRVSLTAANEPNYQTIARRLGLHPYVAQQSVRQASRFSLEKLTMLYDRLVAIDRRLKSSREDPVLLFDQFIIAASA